MSLQFPRLSCFNPNVLSLNKHATYPAFSVAKKHTPISKASGRRLKISIYRPKNSLPRIAWAHNHPKHSSAVQYAERRAQYYEKRGMPSDPATLQRIETCGVLASQPYHRKTPVPTGWYADQVTLYALANKLQQTLGGNMKVCDGGIVDTTSGLTAMVFVHPKDQVYMLSFGGTKSGKAVMRKTRTRGISSLTPGPNFSITVRQHFANASAALGATPASYKQAAALARTLQQQLEQNPDYQGFSLHLTGHSKGGGEAMYAALSADTPIPATVFCPAHLSTGLIADLPLKNLERATEFIKSYSVRGDPVPALRGKLFSIRGIGTGHHVYIPSLWGLKAHSIEKLLAYLNTLIGTEKPFIQDANACTVGA